MAENINERLDNTAGKNAWLDEAKFWMSRSLNLDEKEQFHTYWTVKGHLIREKMNDDYILVCMLKHVLPPYIGNDLWIYRGENFKRHSEGRIGLCWTRRREIAECFARGLNSVPSGGLLLKAHAEPKAIIAGPSKHSCYLQEDEYTVDPLALTYEVICRFPQME